MNAGVPEPSPEGPRVAVVPLAPAWVLLATLLAFDAATLLGHMSLAGNEALGNLFDLDHEANLPTWYSSLKLLLAAAAAMLCYLSEAPRAAAEGLKRRSAWLVVAALMLALSADEAAQIHETLTDWLMSGKAGANFRQAFGANEASDSMLWVVVFSPLMVLAAAALLLFYLARFKSSPLLIASGAVAILLLAGSAFLETREATIASTEGFLSTEQWRTYRWYVGFEEMAEQIAVTLLLVTHYHYATSRSSRHLD